MLGSALPTAVGTRDSLSRRMVGAAHHASGAPQRLGRPTEEDELESAARRYEHFYIRLLDDQKTPSLMTPGMADNPTET